MARALVWITYFSLLDLRFHIFASLSRDEEWGCWLVQQSSGFTAVIYSLDLFAQFLQIPV